MITIDQTAKFRVVKRRNVHAKNSHEWALNVKIGSGSYWTIRTWDNQPSEQEAQCAKDACMRAFMVYHEHLQFPGFDLKATE